MERVRRSMSAERLFRCNDVRLARLADAAGQRRRRAGDSIRGAESQLGRRRGFIDGPGATANLFSAQSEVSKASTVPVAAHRSGSAASGGPARSRPCVGERWRSVPRTRGRTGRSRRWLARAGIAGLVSYRHMAGVSRPLALALGAVGFGMLAQLVPLPMAWVAVAEPATRPPFLRIPISTTAPAS